MNKNNYFCRVMDYCMVIVQRKLLFVVKVLSILISLNFVFVVQCTAGVIKDEGNDASPVAYDEIPVRVVVEGYKMFYLDAIYTHNKLLYVNIEDLFRTLNIPCTVEPSQMQLTGFIGNENKVYSIDYISNQLKVANKTFSRPNGLLSEMDSYYVESSLLTEAFGIALAFNYRAMTITLKSSFELPVIKQMRTEKMRSNLAKIQGNEIADTVLKRNYHLFKFGTLDWLVNTTQTAKESSHNHFGFGLGTELLFGEADVSLNYYNQYKFDDRQLQYIWRWVDNENKIIKQAQVGKISNPTISFINSPVVGAVVRNSPTTVRKATGYYSINEVTEPNWTVELYINNVLVNYTQADASGSYTFNVPIVYGYTTLKLKFYGPLGEERTEERTMNVPYTVMPTGEFEYSLSAGVVQDSSNNRLGKGEFNYGVSRILTIGGGLEYLSSIPNRPFIPYAKATFQPFSKLTLNGEYAYGVRTKGLLNYYFGKDILLELNYTKYVEGQLATRFNADVERKVRLSFPMKYKKINGFVKLDFTQLDYREFKYNQANIMFSAYYKQFSANSSTQMNWIDQRTSYITDDLALSYRFKNGLVLRPSARYNLDKGSVMSCKAEIEKRISRVYLSATYERNFSFNDHYINVSFKYDLPFARTSISASHSKEKFSTSQSAQGSVAFGGDNYTHLSNNSSVSKGGLLIYPFLDMNHNGVFDKGEHMVRLNSLKINGGKAIFSEKDSIVRIPDLNAFTNYLLEFKDNNLENIAWRFTKNIYQVVIDPNQFKRVEIPIISVGEASGMVYMGKNHVLKGLGRITIRFYDKKSNKIVAETLSESDGYVYFLGLEPGDYIARIDTAQLRILGLSAAKSELPFTIVMKEQGDMVDGLDFILYDPNNDQLQSSNSTGVLLISQDLNNGNVMVLNENPEQLKKGKGVLPQENPIIKELDEISEIPVQSNTIDPPIENKEVAFDSVAAIFASDTTKMPSVLNAEKLLGNFKTDSINQPEKSDTVQLLGDIKIITTNTDDIANSSDTSSLKGMQVSVKQENRNIVVVKDTTQNIQPSQLHRIDQSNSISMAIAREFLAEDTLFKVQLLAVKRPLKDKKYFAKLIDNIPGLTIEETLGEDGLYHYSTKTFTGIAEAAKYQSMIKKSGWKDSFVAKYAGERRTEASFRRKLASEVLVPNNNVPLKQLPSDNQNELVPDTKKDESYNKENNISLQGKNLALPYSALHQGNVIIVGNDKLSQYHEDTIFVVQLLAVSKPIVINTYFALLFSKIPGLKISESMGSDGLYRYTADTFTNMEKARKFNSFIRQSGWVDSFITTYVGEVKRN